MFQTLFPLGGNGSSDHCDGSSHFSPLPHYFFGTRRPGRLRGVYHHSLHRRSGRGHPYESGRHRYLGRYPNGPNTRCATGRRVLQLTPGRNGRVQPIHYGPGYRTQRRHHHLRGRVHEPSTQYFHSLYVRGTLRTRRGPKWGYGRGSGRPTDLLLPSTLATSNVGCDVHCN